MRKINFLVPIVCLLMSSFSYGEEEFRFKPKYASIEEELAAQKNSEYERSFLKSYMTREQYESTFGTPAQAALEERKRQNQNRFGHKIKTITIDTRNREACSKVQQRLLKAFDGNEKYENLCAQNDAEPYVTVSLIDKEKSELRIYLDEILPERSSSTKETPKTEILRQTRNFMGLGLAMMGLLYALPEDVTNWDREDIRKNWHRKWKDNVEAGPVVDKDDWYINYIGHPVSGAAYHVVARHAGLDKWEAFGYSVFMSTVFWEYGFEAVAEVPSIQDLILTPVVGSLLGEMFISLEKTLEENDGVLLGSETFGSVVGVLIDPAGPMLDYFNNLFEFKIFEDARTSFYIRERNPSDYTNGIILPDSREIGIEFEFIF